MRHTAILAVLFVVSGVALAQTAEVSVSLGAARFSNGLLGDLSESSKLKADANFRIGVRFTFNQGSRFGHEIGYAYNHAKLTETLSDGSNTDLGGLPVHQGMYNFLVYAFKPGTLIRPFATGGVHFSSYYPPGASVFSGNGTTKFGFNYGAGVKVKLGSLLLGRVDFREYMNGKPDFGTHPSGLMRMYEISAGVGVAF
jgi:opacity protein-like surface antigen